MRTSPPKGLVLTATLITAIFTSFLSVANAQIVTNWVAFNDHRPGPLIPPHIPSRTNWGTSVRATTYNMGAPTDTTGNLTNFLNGEQLPVTVSFFRTNAPDDFGTLIGPATNSPAGQLFFGIVDLGNSGIVGVDQIDGDTVTMTINNLDPAKRYVFRGTSGRGGGYAGRWTVATIMADGWIDAHITGSGSPGVITSNDFPANLGPGQAAWNSGDNVEGDVIGWDFITPRPDGSFSILCEQYVGPYHGGMATSDNYGYAFAAMLLAEVVAAAPIITTNPPAQTLVEQNHGFSLRVSAAGTALLYQWYKQGVGSIAGATFPTFTVPQAAVSDTGDYFAVVYNPVGSVTSTVAHVTVYADTNAATVASVYAYPAVEAGTLNATLNQVTVEFDEPVDTNSATTLANYTLSGGGGNPASVTLTNSRTAILTYPSALPEDTAFTLTVNAIVDTVGNVSGSSTTPFRTWVRGPGNGILFEAFDAGTGVDVIALTSSPVFPDNPFLRTNLWAFDSRVVHPDDTLENFGSRLRGVFFPPVSGNWVFFLRTYDRGEVYLNPNGLDPAGKILILAEVTGNEPRDWNRFISPAFSLRGGQGYYIEGLNKAQTGTNVIKVAARLANTGFPPSGVPNEQLDPSSLMGATVGTPLAPRDLGGPLTIVQDVADRSTEENHLTTLAVLVTNPSNLPIFYQWFRNNTAIPGATGPTYSFVAAPGDDGATFRVEAAKVGSTIVSRTATLTVAADSTPPHAIVAYTTDTNQAYVIIQFDEEVNLAQAEDQFSYTLDGSIFPASAFLSNGTTVILGFDVPLDLDSSHQLAIEGILDLTGQAIDPNPTTLTFNAAPLMPRLSIVRAGSAAIISWPAPAPGFILEQASEIVTPASAIAWTKVDAPILIINGHYNVTVNATAGTRVFRLRR